MAYSNGANDNFKGVATLYASGAANYKQALVWGTTTTFLGSVASIVLAQGLLSAFSGKGLVPPELAGGGTFLLAVAAGAGGAVILATRLGFPISTTHSLVGGIVGSGVLAAGADLNTTALASTFLLPLLLSPGIAFFLAVGLSWLVKRGRGERSLRPSKYINGGHFLSAGLVSFARGLNDTPKIAALLLVVGFINVPASLVIIGVGMAVGGLLSARRVATTLGCKITTLNHEQGLAANIATGILVIWASRMGVPVSTTHVSVGALVGIGVTSGQANPTVIRNVVLSWLFTLPCAAALAAGTYWLAEATLQ